MVLIAEITTYKENATDDTEFTEGRWGVNTDTTCALCNGHFSIGEAVISYDYVGSPWVTYHYHPSCLEVLVSVAILDMAELVKAKGFVLGTYIAPRKDNVIEALNTIVFSGTVQLPHSRVR